MTYPPSSIWRSFFPFENVAVVAAGCSIFLDLGLSCTSRDFNFLLARVSVGCAKFRGVGELGDGSMGAGGAAVAWTRQHGPGTIPRGRCARERLGSW